MEWSEDAAVLKILIEKDHVYEFLAGRNPEFDQVRIQMLGNEATPSLEETISLILGEESRMSTMLEPQALENSALITKNESPHMLEKEKSDLSRLSGKENQI